MGFRFYRRVKIFPGLYLNFSKKGVSTSVGTKGARLTFSKDGTRATVGIPGSGISYSEYSSKRKHSSAESVPVGTPDAKWDRKTYIGCSMILFLILCPIVAVIVSSHPWREEWSDTENEAMSKAILERELRKRYPKKFGQYGDEFSFRKIEHSKQNRSCYMEGMYSNKKHQFVKFKALFSKPVDYDKHSRNWMKVEYIQTE